MKKLSQFIGPYGLIRHLNDGTESGGGDTLNREGHYWFIRKFDHLTIPYFKLNWGELFVRDLHFDDVIARLWFDNFLVRYPEGPYNNPWFGKFYTSRDQLEAMLRPLRMWNQKEFWIIEQYLYKNNWLGPGLDPFFKECFTIFQKAEKDFAKRFLVYLGDFIQFGSVLVRCLVSWFDKTNVGDSVNMTQALIYENEINKTWVARLNAWVFGKFVYGGVMYQLRTYFNPPSPHIAPPIDVMYQPLVQHFFKAKPLCLR